jgi:NAD(P)-dependent dehydrogenase (short-subunit alcohol dehydrogenase family)
VNLELSGRAAVVTGGTSGIGLCAVRRLLDEGMSVAFCARNRARVDAVTQELAQTAGADRVLGAVADVLDVAALDAFRAQVEARFGRADVLVHNAGRSRMAGFDGVSDADWSEEFELKFFGLLRPTRTFLPLLRKSDAASMVYVSSLLAKQPERRLIATSAARGGALNLAKSMSFEFAPAIRVNSILLGVIDTGQWESRLATRRAAGETIERDAYIVELAQERGIPLGRIGRPEEVAAAIAFLASPLCGFMTGAVIEISGGFSHYV